MTAKVFKCIGGIWDGRTVAVKHGARHQVVREYEKRSALEFIGVTAVDLTERANYAETLYVLDSIRNDSERIEFLRPFDWTIEQALRHALVEPSR